MNITAANKIRCAEIDARKEAERIIEELRRNVCDVLKKRGAVVGISGGIDSSVVFALCVRAFGPERVIGVMLPETDSSFESLYLAKMLVTQFHGHYLIEDMTQALEGLGCYRRRDEAIKRIFPEFGVGCKAKIAIPAKSYDHNALTVFNLVISKPDGTEKTARLPIREYLEIVAASNFKQRSRMSMLYYHAEVRNYAVIGTGNKNEHEQGFFVKYGDGAADIKPIAHLFKTQVYQLADYLNIPEQIRKRIPTTDTYSAEQTQEEFFFGVSFEMLDYIWENWENGRPEDEIAASLKMETVQVRNIISDIQRKMRTTEYLRKEPIQMPKEFPVIKDPQPGTLGIVPKAVNL